MGKYTLLNNKELDKKIDKDITLCKKYILKLFGNKLLSLVLIGGYGREEGGVVKSGIKLYPKNNYDFLIVLKRTLFWKKKKIKKSLQRLKRGLDKKLLVLFEASFQSKNKIKNASNIMIYQDIYNSSKTVYGEDIKRLLPCRVTKTLEPIEALRVIRNRSMLLLACIMKDHLNYKPSAQQMKIWVSKAIIGFGDAILILKKNYKSKYVDKMNTIQKLSFSDVFKNKLDYNYFKKLHKTASLYRLKDQDSKLLNNFDKILKILEQVNLWAIKKYTKDPEFILKKLSNIHLHPKESSLKILRNILVNLKEYGIKQDLKNIFIHPRNKLFKVVPLILFNQNKRSLNYCKRELKISTNGFEQINKECNRLYAKYLV
jgi:hypothetical protein